MTTASTRAATALDLRLAAPTVSAWSAAALAPALSWAVSLVLVLVLVAAGLVMLVLTPVAGREERGARPRVGRGLDGEPAGGWGARAVAVGCTAALLCAAAGLGAAALRQQSRRTGPVAALARAGDVVVASAAVTGDPRPVRPKPGRPGRPLVALAARLDTVTGAGRTWAVRQPVLVLAPPSGWSDLLPSQRLRLTGRLSAPRPGDTVAAVVSVHGPPALLGRPSGMQRLAGRLRAGLRDSAAGLGPDERGLLPGLVDGDTAALPADLQDAVAVTGLTHVVAVSGSNVAIVLATVVVVLGTTGLGLRGRALSSAGALAGFVVLARPSPSVLRAALMGGVAIVGSASGRSRSAVPALLGTTLVLVLANPDLARAPGFALSVLATGGLLVLAPGWRSALAQRLPPRLADAVAVPLAAQLACAPVIAAMTGTVSLVAVPANLLALPAVVPATVLGVLDAAVAPLSPTLARLLARLAAPCCWWVAQVARRGAALPMAQAPWADGLSGAVSLTAATVAGLALLRRCLRPALLRPVIVTVGLVAALSAGARALVPQPTATAASGAVLAAADRRARPDVDVARTQAAPAGTAVDRPRAGPTEAVAARAWPGTSDSRGPPRGTLAS